MQTKGQIKRNWKVVAAATAVSAIGLSGLAVANPGASDDKPDAISLKDRHEITQLSSRAGLAGFQIAGLDTGTADTGNDSPFGDLDTGSPSPDTGDTVSPSPDTATVSPVGDTATDSPDGTNTVDTDTVSATFDTSVDS